MIPIANIALIDYVIDFLTSNGVEEIFFFSRVHRKQINDYINSQNYREIKTQYLQSSTASNMGDVLREINDMMIIDGHFLLVRGDIVSNISFLSAIELHLKMNEKNTANPALVTKILLQVGHTNRIRTGDDDNLIILDSYKKQIVKFDSLDEASDVLLTPNVKFKPTSTPLELRYDLIDSHINICSPHILPHFAEHFHCQVEFIRYYR